MPTKDNLENILSTIRQSKYRDLVRAKGASSNPESLDVIKSGGDEYYFNMSPYEQFMGRSIQMTVSTRGEYQLGASFGKLSDDKDVIHCAMKDLTGNEPDYGTDINGNIRADILRCTINTDSESVAMNTYLNFYRQVFL